MQFHQLDQARRFAESGEYRKAHSAYTSALKSAPRNPDILMELAVLEAENGKLKAAHRLLKKAQKLIPDEPAVYLNLAEVANLSERYRDAAAHYRRALDLSPQDPDALYGLGNTLRLLDRMDEALPLLDKAHELVPDDAEVLNALAIVLEHLGQLGRSMQCYHRAITLAPDYYEAWCNYAQLLYREAYYGDAAKSFAGAKRCAKGNLPTEMLLNWAASLSYDGQYDQAFALVDRAIEQDDMPAPARHSRGSLLMQVGDFDKARACFHDVITLNPDAGEAYEKLSRMGALEDFIPDKLQRILDNETLPGSARSGAGFALYKMLDRAGNHEDAFTALCTANALQAAALPFNRDTHERLITATIETFTPDFFAAHKDQGLDTEVPVFILGMPRSGTTLCEQILAAYDHVKPCGERADFQRIWLAQPDYPKRLGELPPSWARENGERILNLMTGNAADVKIATNKSPGNYSFIGLIAWIFPRARIIYCKRDPRDIGLSSFEQNFQSGLSFTYDLEAFAFAYRQHERVMRHWMDVAPLDIHVVDYERLVSHTEATARPLIEFCGLEWRAECLDTGRVTRPIETASVWQVRQPINKGSVGKWKRYERQLKPMLDALGVE